MNSRPSSKVSALVLLPYLLVGTLPVEASVSTEDVRNYYNTAMLLEPKYRAALVCVIIFTIVGGLTLVALPIVCWRKHRRRKREREKLANQPIDESW